MYLKTRESHGVTTSRIIVFGGRSILICAGEVYIAYIEINDNTATVRTPVPSEAVGISVTTLFSPHFKRCMMTGSLGGMFRGFQLLRSLSTVTVQLSRPSTSGFSFVRTMVVGKINWNVYDCDFIHAAALSFQLILSSVVGLVTLC